VFSLLLFVQSGAGEGVDTNQFSVTEQAQLISLQDAFRGDAQRIPGVFFVSEQGQSGQRRSNMQSRQPAVGHEAWCAAGSSECGSAAVCPCRYDLSPFMVRVTERRTPLSSFLTSVCAIVGGVLTVAGVLDALLFAGAKMVKTKANTPMNSPHSK